MVASFSGELLYTCSLWCDFKQACLASLPKIPSHGNILHFSNWIFSAYSLVHNCETSFPFAALLLQVL